MGDTPGTALVAPAAHGRVPTPLPGRGCPANVPWVNETSDSTPAYGRPYDIGHLIGTLVRVPGDWRRRSTWWATARLLLWLGTSYLLALTTLVGLVAALLTGWITGPARTVRALMLRILADSAEIDHQRIAHFSGVRIPPFPFPTVADGASPATHRRAWLQSALRWRLPVYALIRALAASLAVAVAMAWWWLTIVSIDIAFWRLLVHRSLWDSYFSPVHVLGHTFTTHSVTQTSAIIRSVIGVAGVLLWPAVPRAVSALDAALAQRLCNWLSGPSTGELSREVERISQTRTQMIAAADAERRRIERDLHDGFQPQLVNLALNLGLARSRLATDPDGAHALLDRAHEDAKRATEDLRNLVRGIHPSVIDERGLDAALSALAAGSHVRLQIDVRLAKRPPRGAEGIAYFVVAEAVTNINKHANAHMATIAVSEANGSLRLLIQDDGRGGARIEPGGGLAGLADRIAAVDGTFSVTSPAGGPTLIEARIPCER